MISLFGFPVYKTSLSNEQYDRDELIKTINHNYDLDNNRNSWDNDWSDLHHSVDDNNDKFKSLNYSQLLPIYEKSIISFIKELKMNNNVRFDYRIVNYTCMTDNQYMQSHLHTDADFTGVHYLQYDDTLNNSTTFNNSSHHSKYIEYIRPKLRDNFNNQDTGNSWLFETFRLPTKQDDLVIFPAVMQHSISKVKTTKRRMTIIFNFDIERTNA
tara:strand:- start:118 stop:756 length:639 start_codon:yes stop_codon:yes gene_type:complete